MKKYRLKKDLPFAKAGEVFQEWLGARNQKGERALFSKNHTDTNLWPNDIENFDEWFEEIEEPGLPKEFFYIVGGKISKVEYLTFSFDEDTKQEYKEIIEREKSVGNYFETGEEAKKYLEYLKAKTIIKQDAKGFKPDWTDREAKYYAYWDFEVNEPDWSISYTNNVLNIWFKSRQDILYSLEKHPEEWKILLTYEQ